MQTLQELSAETRSGTGKGPAYQTRQKGLIPAIIYGGGSAPEPVALDRRELERFALTATFLTTPFLLNLPGQKVRVIPRDVQLDPVSDRPVHVDFMRLPEGAEIRLDIPVRFKGQETSPGIKRGGVLNIVLHELQLMCPADRIPPFIEVDLSSLDIHGTVHISNISLPEGVRAVIRDRDFTIASIVAPMGLVEELRTGGATAAPAAEAAPAKGAPAKAPAKAADKK